MEKRFSKFIYEISRDSRQTTKNLGKILRTSQQNISYMLQTAIKKKQVLGFYTLIDPARFSLISLLVLYNYKKIDSKSTNEIKKNLKENPYVTMIEECSPGADLIVQYTVPNLSLFNKENQEFIFRFRNNIKESSVYSIIVKHTYNRKYLIPKTSNFAEYVLSGDRDAMMFNGNQKAIMRELKHNSRISIVRLAEAVNLDSKTVVKIKKDLEEKKVIRQYSIIVNHDIIGIERERVFLKLDHDSKKETERFIEFCRIHKNILSVIKLIGQYDILITIEKIEKKKDVLNEIRREFNITDYRVIYIKEVLKNETIPDCVLE